MDRSNAEAGVAHTVAPMKAIQTATTAITRRSMLMRFLMTYSFGRGIVPRHTVAVGAETELKRKPKMVRSSPVSRANA
ncbi:hypothetical protein Prum_010250 [Phytohabitans rumicis]|uniref:Uncharacterized protein n=1 Tax=Phytohabitans rumicis TaxID=1076125 RepID=A0A6V8KQB5_9ACTN|nr:hypothetical protein Prum_010250 [Phytohabitans rumicis]